MRTSIIDLIYTVADRDAWRKAWAQPWPGLVGSNVNITTGEFIDANGGWNGAYTLEITNMKLANPPQAVTIASTST